MVMEASFFSVFPHWETKVSTLTMTFIITAICYADVRLWDIMAEIITLTLSPSPINPFRINLAYFDTLPLEECVIATGAMMDFLQRVYMKDTPYTESGRPSNYFMDNRFMPTIDMFYFC